MTNKAIERERGKREKKVDGNKPSLVPKRKAVRKGGKQGGEEERTKEGSRPGH